MNTEPTFEFDDEPKGKVFEKPVRIYRIEGMGTRRLGILRFEYEIMLL